MGRGGMSYRDATPVTLLKQSVNSIIWDLMGVGGKSYLEATNQKVGSSNLSGRTIFLPFVQALRPAWGICPFSAISSLCPILCPPSVSIAAKTESSEGCT